MTVDTPTSPFSEDQEPSADDLSSEAERISTPPPAGPENPAATPSPPGPLDPVQVLLDLALTSDPFFSAHLAPIARQLLEQLAPQDPAETMLVVQMIGTFCRSMFLSRYANLQKTGKWFALYSGECDRAMNLFRKQMQTLGDYRRPRRTVFNAIRTANIAGQQVVMNGSARPAKPRKRKAARAQTKKAAQATLPPVTYRPGRPPQHNPAHATVDP